MNLQLITYTYVVSAMKHRSGQMCENYFNLNFTGKVYIIRPYHVGVPLY